MPNTRAHPSPSPPPPREAGGPRGETEKAETNESKHYSTPEAEPIRTCHPSRDQCLPNIAQGPTSASWFSQRPSDAQAVKHKNHRNNNAGTTEEIRASAAAFNGTEFIITRTHWLHILERHVE